MRKLLPFVWLAIAVALGVALAPYVWWLIGIAVASALGWLALGLLWIAWQYVKRIWSRCWRWYLESTVESPPL